MVDSKFSAGRLSTPQEEGRQDVTFLNFPKKVRVIEEDVMFRQVLGLSPRRPPANHAQTWDYFNILKL